MRLTPAKAVEKLRVEAARAALESGASSLQRVANECGFGDAENMRRSFLRLLGVPPSLLRALTRRITDATSASHRWAFP
ncbi:hypothetical protein WJ78_09955 [Burkholderia ubonensis]|uniref:helix-turn-helix domain-containing protein n=1 Tax=Burkholderia ubonensis TaxID=101571 RepID=UPI00075411E6|nr:helix-turn-helix domain-containing protein [Burkholderia ubonensis]KVO69829.1 hypothetical protein WJ78_09955 [Burkholderia ubonensis]KVU99548.1 hypothetical protein WK77_25070 [Burkholderia ubonensis]KVZ42058.1 hypothetical protein WL16_27515 [Burkholderia ubonensis]OJA25011.1 hypothetical protein BGX87_24825 [Burkholderia ubonensis]